MSAPQAVAQIPAIDSLAAPAGWRTIDFISDLHLAEDTPRGFEAWARYLRGTSADAVFMLGDWLELWVGDDARDGAFEQRCIALLTEVSSRRALAFMAGNRDFLIGDEMLQACRMRRLHDPTVLEAFGQRYLLTHGDALCLSDTDYQRFRAQVRSEAFIAQFLARPLAERRVIARGVRDGSEQRKATEARGVWADVDIPEALRWLAAADAPVMIHGHTHRPASQTIGPGIVRHVLSDWDLDTASTLRADVLRLTAEGVHRLSPEQAAA
jgi:UDP-2,3-diacylglucosamine hydrolase